MPHTAIVTFTAKPLASILHDRGSGDWRLDLRRARQTEYLVCAQHRHNTNADSAFGAPEAPHRAAFLIGRIADVVPSPRDPDRWVIKIREYTECNIPNIWGKAGPMRYPVWYTTLEALGIDLGTLPPFEKLPTGGFSDIAGPALVAPQQWIAARSPRLPAAAGRTPVRQALPDGQDGRDGREAWERLDAILAQLDRVPDLPAPTGPLDWDEHGLPR
jgi:hypothetical protein